jgi:hypothetical protein
MSENEKKKLLPFVLYNVLLKYLEFWDVTRRRIFRFNWAKKALKTSVI